MYTQCIYMEKIGVHYEYNPSRQQSDYAGGYLSGSLYGAPGYDDYRHGPANDPKPSPHEPVGPAVGRGRLHPTLCRPDAHRWDAWGPLRAQALLPARTGAVPARLNVLRVCTDARLAALWSRGARRGRSRARPWQSLGAGGGLSRAARTRAGHWPLGRRFWFGSCHRAARRRLAHPDFELASDLFRESARWAPHVGPECAEAFRVTQPKRPAHRPAGPGARDWRPRLPGYGPDRGVLSRVDLGFDPRSLHWLRGAAGSVSAGRSPGTRTNGSLAPV